MTAVAIKSFTCKCRIWRWQVGQLTAKSVNCICIKVYCTKYLQELLSTAQIWMYVALTSFEPEVILLPLVWEKNLAGEPLHMYPETG